MASNQPDDRDVSGASSASAGQDSNTPESSNTMTTPANSSAPRRSTSETRKPSSQSATSQPPTNSAAPPLRTRLSGSLVTTSSTSTGTSPRTSRNTSPIRKDTNKPQPLTTPISTQPSAAAIQRALSAANVPSLQSGPQQDAGRMSRAPKSASASGETTPQWPMSPRLKSPPPSGPNSRRGSAAPPAKKTEGSAPPVINVQNATPQTSTPPPPPRQPSDDASRTQQLQTSAKGPSRGPSGKSTLETVQENSTDDVKEPSPAAIKASADLKPLTRLSDEEAQARKEGNGQSEKPQVESGSESAGKAESKKPQPPAAQSSRPKTTTTKSYTPLASAKSRQGDGKQGMTVETETVPSIPQSAIGAADRSGGSRNDGSGTVRSKLSTETIRPKKERKKPTQKARSLNQGTGTYATRSPLLTSQEFPSTGNSSDSSGSIGSASTARASSSNADSPRPERSHSPQLHRNISIRKPSHYFRTLSDKYLRKASSKADIFEARVANAVEDANSSDSDETFVYESNPPEPQRRRHHSRTPSIASQHSAVDGQRSGIRNFGDLMDERRVAGKRSMKFSNNPYNDPDTPDGKDGSVRSHTPRHFGRFGRGGSHQSMFDQDSPFTQASKLRTGHFSGMRGSRPNSPRSPQPASGHGAPKTNGGLFGRNKEPSYDFDAEGADDERTPLVGTARIPRRYPRRINSSNAASIDEYYGVRRRSRCRRVGGAVLGICILAVVILSAVAFLLMSNRPMYDVQLERIENVLASEEELMLDLYVGAVNPNALGITISDIDVNVFAKSKHVGNGEYWRRHGYDVPALSTSESQPVLRKRRRRRRDPDPAGPGWQDLSHHWHAPASRTTGNRDDGTDPPDDDDLYKDAQTMLLGRIFHLDSALAFDGSPVQRHAHFATGALRLERPGNATEAGGSARWEAVLPFPFELIVRGVLRYRLPISEREESAAVSGSVMVVPEEGVGEWGVEGEEGWEWVRQG